MPSNQGYSKVFIGFIPSSVTEEQLKEDLECYGKLSSMYYMPDASQQPKGWAFVTFEERVSGAAAIEAINGKPYFQDGKETCKAFFVSSRNSCDYLKDNSTIGSCPITSPGFWQRFLTSEGIPFYYNAKTGQSQWQRPPEFVIPIEERKGNEFSSTFGPPGSNLFVFHLPSEWSDADLVDHFKSFGTVVSARVQRDSSGRNRGFGFISYDNPISALEAIKAMNGFNVCGKYLKVQLKKGEEHYLNHGSTSLAFTSYDYGSIREPNVMLNDSLHGDDPPSRCNSLASTLHADEWTPFIIPAQDENSLTSQTEYQSLYDIMTNDLAGANETLEGQLHEA